MSKPLTSRDCELVTYGFSRSNYSPFKAIPCDVLSLMVSRLNLWKYFSLSADQLKSLQQLPWDERERGSKLVIPLGQDFSIDNTLFQPSLRAHTFCFEENDEVRVAVGLDLGFEDVVERIGGYYHISRGRSVGRVRNRIRRHTCTVSADEGDHHLSLIEPEENEMTMRECQDLDTLSFSYLVDILQIKYHKEAKRENMDHVPPLIGCGRIEWTIDGDSLHKLQSGSPSYTVKEKGWSFNLCPAYQSEEVRIYVHWPALPVDVWSFDLKMSGQVELKSKGTLIRPVLCNSEIYECGKWACGVLFKKLTDGICKKDIEKVDVINMDISWQIVGTREGYGTVVRTDWEKLNILMSK